MILRTFSKSELKGCAGTVVRSGPKPPAVTFNNRTTDRQPHSHAAGFGGVESIKNSFSVQWINANSGVLNRHSDLIAFAALSSNCQIALTVFHRAHCFDAVQDQVHDNLLYFYPVGHN